MELWSEEALSAALSLGVGRGLSFAKERGVVEVNGYLLAADCMAETAGRSSAAAQGAGCEAVGSGAESGSSAAGSVGVVGSSGTAATGTWEIEEMRPCAGGNKIVGNRSAEDWR